jgi:subfamily B ATP-binding cassette protein MsbA
MKQFQRIFKYLKDYKGKIALYFLCILLSIVFSMVSLAMLAPFLNLLFGKENEALVKPESILSATDLLDYLKYQIDLLIDEQGAETALGFICILIVSAILLKNVFLYLSYRILAPMRNGVLTRLRGDLYDKVLKLPIGYFTEQRKGDLISRMSNDANEVEWSVMMALEVLIKEPLTIIF